MHRQIITRFFLLSFIQQTVIGSLIVNGDKVADDAMQYMASLQSMGDHVCGGFLVSENYVLTAAHCSDLNPDTVVLGNHNLRSRKLKKFKIKKEIKHNLYKTSIEGNDLMLLELKKKAQLGNGVQIINLPDENMKVGASDLCEIAGWGPTTIGGIKVKDLFSTKVSIMDSPTCKTKWHNLPPEVICAARNNNIRTFNEGDHGGPLVCNNIAVGIASFNKDGQIEGPNVFVDISKYLKWIKEHITVS